MTRKDYRLIAQAITYARYAGDPTPEGIVRQLIRALAENNPKFNAVRFSNEALLS